MRKILTAAAVVVVASAGTAAAQTKWNMPTAYPDSNYHTQNVRWFADEVKKATDGKLEIVVHSGASLFKMPEIKRAVQTGQVPIGEILLSAYGNEDPVLEVDGLPFLAAGYDQAWKLYQAQRATLQGNLQKQGLLMLFSVAWPGQGVYSKNPINSLSDFKGVKFRAYNAVTARLAELIGAQPATVQQAEVPQAFSAGVISAMITSGATGVDTKAWEFSKYFYETEAMHPRNGVLVNQRAFRRLPEEQQRILLNIAELAEKRGWELMQKVSNDTKATLAKNGMTVAAPPAALQAEYKKIGSAMVAEWEKKAGAAGAAIIKAYRQ
ncbi:C4-dicarboxylate ABC transporter substrate-binding protein [Allostella sp. ATCC 35155]|nr:C4-dicarboxylate ABC transporter substrate-binding protein [Stella sp. ATCC 35155]